MGALRDFVADVLDSAGAAVDPIEPDGLEVLAPEPLRAAMGWTEISRLGFGATTPAGAVPIRLEGDWLDRFGALLGKSGRFAARQLVVAPAVAPPSDPQHMIERALDLPNAIWRLHGAAPAWTRCLLLAFRYSAVSDERRDGLVWIGLNQGTGAAFDGDSLGRLRAAAGHQPLGTRPSPTSAAPPERPMERPKERPMMPRRWPTACGRSSPIMFAAIWSPSSPPCAAGWIATAAASTNITMIYAGAHKRD